ncbi:MAG: methionine--tRNA ligase subunit beta, partial [Saprospiraceae bacterium]|nr:methionine--tRNA ligase subunit beta [Saprospiraceae bacterium]
INDDPERVKVVLNLGLQYVTALAIAMRPFLPFAAERLRKMLNLPAFRDDREWLDLLNDLAEGNPALPSNHLIEPAEHLFSRISDEQIEAQIQKLQAAAAANQLAAAPPVAEKNPYAPVKATIQYDDFAKLDIRTGTILEASKVEKADKLLQLTVDLGFEKRTIVSGIAQHYAPEAIVGKQVLVLANLAPRKMRGIESEGMILMAEDADGRLSFVSPVEGWPDGGAVS